MIEFTLGLYRYAGLSSGTISNRCESDYNCYRGIWHDHLYLPRSWCLCSRISTIYWRHCVNKLSIYWYYFTDYSQVYVRVCPVIQLSPERAKNSNIAADKCKIRQKDHSFVSSVIYFMHNMILLTFYTNRVILNPYNDEYVKIHRYKRYVLALPREFYKSGSGTRKKSLVPISTLPMSPRINMIDHLIIIYCQLRLCQISL